MGYDCRSDVEEHKKKVSYWLTNFIHILTSRSVHHDESKLESFERSVFNEWTPNLKTVEFGSQAYKEALEGMGVGLKHHYENNRHHPEHYENGINGMTLMDLVEMVADWMAAAGAKNQQVNLDYLAERFGISDQLVEIIANTLREEDLWNNISGSCENNLCPENRMIGHVEGFITSQEWSKENGK
jgi:hypothetical protein